MDEPESIILIAYGKYLSIGYDFSYDYSIVMWPGVKPDPTRLQFHLKLKLLFFFIISRLRRGLRGFSSCLVTLSSETTLDVRRFDFVKKLKIWLPPATETTSACTHREAQVASSLFKTVLKLQKRAPAAFNKTSTIKFRKTQTSESTDKDKV